MDVVDQDGVEHEQEQQWNPDERKSDGRERERRACVWNDRRRDLRDEIEVDAMVEQTIAENGGHGSNAGHGDPSVRSVDGLGASNELHFEGGRERAEHGGAEHAENDLAGAMHRAPRAALQRIGDGHPAFDGERDGEPNARVRREVGDGPADGENDVGDGRALKAGILQRVDDQREDEIGDIDKGQSDEIVVRR